jgi:type IV pilus assembly protein PilQ
VLQVGAGKALGVALALSLIGAGAAAERSQTEEALISLDIKDAAITDMVRLMAEIGSFQVVVDPGVSCSLTVKLKEVRWQTALDVALRSCGLAQEEENGIVRVAPAQKLLAEHQTRLKLEEARRLNQPTRTTLHRLSYAKAEELAPLIKKFLSPRGEVVVDVRTNTLLITDIP